jgi:putative hydrolase of the HAD superfamily
MLRDALNGKSWFGFDLDDTLHEFRKASGSASRVVFANVASRFGIGPDLLAADYSQILISATKSAFTDGRTSAEYRKERFAALLDRRGLQYDEVYVGYLANEYKSALRSALQLKPGAIQLLQYVKQIGKKIIVVTEGPTDAQVWTVQQLGLEPYVDILVTTNQVGKAKIDGLFTEVLRIYQIVPKDLVYIGDSLDRDIVPATQAGILAIHFDEENTCYLDIAESHSRGPAVDKPLQVNSLAKIQELMSSC